MHSITSIRLKWVALVVVASLAVVAGLLLSWDGLQYSVREETYTVTEYFTTTAFIYPRIDLDDGYGVVVVNGLQVVVEIADTDVERRRGLSGRDGLEPGFGMLFIFPSEGVYSFWMYRMKFPIDMIWMDSGGRVVYIVEDAQPCGDSLVCPVYTPDKPAKYVLEVNAGFVKMADLKLGDVVTILLPVGYEVG